VGKSRLCGEARDPGPHAGDHVPLIDHGDEIGTILRTKERCKPLYISAGNRIDQETALSLVLSSLRGYRLPEPTRLAHAYVNAVRTGKSRFSLPAAA